MLPRANLISNLVVILAKNNSISNGPRIFIDYNKVLPVHILLSEGWIKHQEEHPAVF
jgi:hypothetical protein